MNILINASNLKKGGALQVADSILCGLKKLPRHRFIVVVSSYMQDTVRRMGTAPHVEVVVHDISNSWRTLLAGRDRVLDALVESRGVDAVVTIFGPSRWNPRRPHLSGFARSHLVLRSSPYFRRMRWADRMKEHLRSRALRYFFARSTRCFFTENPMISARLEKLIRGSRVYTVSNYYHPVYDRPERWKPCALPPFAGTTMLTVTAAYPHKNLEIALPAARYLKRTYPEFRFRFVFTITREEYPAVDEELQEHFLFVGRVDITRCPSLYRQCDIMFQPTLLECFTATYPEAMKMERPIVTTDLDFARGLCREAARYYAPLSAESAAEAIHDVATNGELRERLVKNGRAQLNTYDNYQERTHKIINIMEQEFARKNVKTSPIGGVICNRPLNAAFYPERRAA